MRVGGSRLLLLLALAGCVEEEDLVTGFSCDFEGRCPGALACAPDFTCQPAAPECEAPRATCGLQCVDLESSDGHCGSCGNACPSNESCVAGECTGTGNMTCLFCGPGVACVNGGCNCEGRGELCSMALCIDTAQLAFSCGGCFATCPNAGELCRAGACTCPPEQRLCGSECTKIDDVQNCGTCGVACGSGQRCETGQCVASCSQPQSCGSSSCFDVANDAAHCGSACRTCPENGLCAAGVCGCPAGSIDCNGKCIDTTRDTLHCGSCNRACASGESCTAGACGCQAGLTRCGAACTQVLDDADNCGVCGNACGPAQLCSRGQCVTGCELGVEACQAERMCRSGLNPFHCGDCGTVCDPGEVCIDDSCEVQRPAPGCTGCPCEACDELCCLRDGKPTCVAAYRCPQ